VISLRVTTRPRCEPNSRSGIGIGQSYGLCNFRAAHAGLESEQAKCSNSGVSVVAAGLALRRMREYGNMLTRVEWLVR